MSDLCPHCSQLREKLNRAIDANRYLAWSNRQLQRDGARIMMERKHEAKAAAAGVARAAKRQSAPKNTDRVLGFLRKHGPSKPSAMMEALGLDRRQMTSVLESLRKRGCVRGVPSRFRRGRGRAEYTWHLVGDAS